jgi:hypothetical protein
MKLQLLKKDFKLLASILFVFVGFGLANAQTNTWDGSSSNNWNTSANWSLNHVPLATEDVVIPNNKTVTVNTDAVCKSFIMESGNQDVTVTISGSNSLTVTEGVDIDNGTGSGDDRILAVGSGTLSCAYIVIRSTGNNNRDSRITVSTGTVTVTGDVTMEDSATRNLFVFSGSGTLNIGGTMTGGSFTESTSTVNYNGSGAQTIGTYTYNNLTTSTSGVKTLPSGATINGTVRIEGTSTLLAGNTNLINNSSAVQLNGGTYKTGATAGYTEQVGVLTLNDDSIIALGTGNHTLTFANSSGATWTSGKKLTVTGWVGGYNGTGASGTNPKLFVGTAATHLTTAQKAQIRFFDGTNYFAATQLSTGQVVPTATVLPGISGFSPSSLCAGGSITLTGTGFAGVTAVRVNGVNVASYTVNSTTSITAVLAAANTTGDITVVMASGTYSTATNLIVNPIPTSVTASASASPICIGGSVNLTSSATSNSASGPVTLINENFNGATNSWTKINNSTGGTVANSAWTLRPNNYNSGSQYGTTIRSNDSSQFYLSDSDMQGSAGTTHTILQSPAFSTVGLSDASFSFYHYFRFYQGSVTIDVSTNGSSWTTLDTYTSNQGGATSFQQVTFSLNDYLSQPTVYVRFKYDSSWGYYWAIDNVLISGTLASAPATYAWTSTPSGYTSSVQNPTGVSPTVNTTYTVTATNSYGCTASATTSSVVVNPATVGGAVTGGSTTCSGSTSGLLTLAGHTGAVVRWESSVSPFSTWTTIANTSTTYTSGALTQTTQFRAVVQSGVCATANSATTTVTINGPTTWNGTSWNNGAPTSTTAAIISGNYTSSSDLTACSLTVTNNAVVVISTGNSVTLSGGLTVDSGSSFTLENNANLLQNGATNLNSGAITVKRHSSALMRQDYTLWSSPVAGQQLQSFSPMTLSNRFYTYNTTGNVLSAVSSPSTTDFATAHGYLIRMPNNHPATATVWTAGAFVGVPNSGDYTFTMADGGAGNRFNLVGNPYPSPIDAVDFVSNPTNAANITGTLYVWRKTNNAASPTYCTWTTGGFVSNGEAQVYDPNDIIQTGQGFFVEKTGNGSALVFNNTMRIDDHANQFFRTASTVERHRIWLNATGANGLFSQAMVGYMTNASNAFDATIDGKYINDGAIALTSLIENEASVYAIQGRSLPFDSNDVVPMQFKANAAGTYSIAIDHVDGLFSGEQNIYLRDALTGVDHDLKSGAYSFTTEAGTFANRFSVVYTQALSVENPTMDANAVVVYKNANQSFTVNSGSVTMSSINVFDIRGRLLTTQTGINANETIVSAGQANEVLLIQVTSIDGAVVTKKVVR